MAEVPLVESYKKAGRKLVDALKERPDFEVSHAFWQYSTDSEEWVLFLATPLYEQVPLTDLYGRVRETIAETESGIGQHQIQLLNPSRPPVTFLPEVPDSLVAGSTDRAYWADAPSSSSTATGAVADDMLVYPMKQGGAKRP